MAACELNTTDERFDLEAGTPELPEASAPARLVVVQPVAAPGLAGVSAISLASSSRESGRCRCGACLVLPENIDWLD